MSRTSSLRAFVHPFVLDSVDVGDDPGRAPNEGGASASEGASEAEARRPTFYLVGIVDDSEFASAAIRLRLALVVEATLVLLVLLTLAPLLWEWTAGDRLAIRRPALTVICAAPVVGLVLLTVLACGMVTNRIDEHVFDDALAQVSVRIVNLFDQEMSNAIRELQGAVPRLLELDRADRERQRRSAGREAASVEDQGPGWRGPDPAGEGALLRRFRPQSPPPLAENGDRWPLPPG